MRWDNSMSTTTITTVPAVAERNEPAAATAAMKISDATQTSQAIRSDPKRDV